MNTLHPSECTIITHRPHLCLISAQVHEDRWHLLITDPPPVMEPFELMFPEYDVILPHAGINAFGGTIEVIEESGLLTRITLRYHDSRVHAIVLTSLARTFAVGETIQWGVLPTHITLRRI